MAVRIQRDDILHRQHLDDDQNRHSHCHLHAVKEGGVAEADVQAYEANSANLLAWGSTQVAPPEAKGTASFTLSFNDTTPFGTVQWVQPLDMVDNSISPHMNAFRAGFSSMHSLDKPHFTLLISNTCLPISFRVLLYFAV
jgi:hypothetical protein